MIIYLPSQKPPSGKFCQRQRNYKQCDPTIISYPGCVLCSESLLNFFVFYDDSKAIQCTIPVISNLRKSFKTATGDFRCCFVLCLVPFIIAFVILGFLYGTALLCCCMCILGPRLFSGRSVLRPLVYVIHRPFRPQPRPPPLRPRQRATRYSLAYTRAVPV